MCALKWLFVLLIFYVKLSLFMTSPLHERNKTFSLHILPNITANQDGGDGEDGGDVSVVKVVSVGAVGDIGSSGSEAGAGASAGAGTMISDSHNIAIAIAIVDLDERTKAEQNQMTNDEIDENANEIENANVNVNENANMNMNVVVDVDERSKNVECDNNNNSSKNNNSCDSSYQTLPAVVGQQQQQQYEIETENEIAKAIEVGVEIGMQDEREVEETQAKAVSEAEAEAVEQIMEQKLNEVSQHKQIDSAIAQTPSPSSQNEQQQRQQQQQPIEKDNSKNNNNENNQNNIVVVVVAVAASKTTPTTPTSTATTTAKATTTAPAPAATIETETDAEADIENEIPITTFNPTDDEWFNEETKTLIETTTTTGDEENGATDDKEEEDHQTTIQNDNNSGIENGESSGEGVGEGEGEGELVTNETENEKESEQNEDEEDEDDKDQEEVEVEEGDDEESNEYEYEYDDNKEQEQEEEEDLNSGNNQSGYNQSDVYNYLMRYESDGGNACLLDGFKDYLMWWSNANGTLKEWNFSLKVENMISLDFSYHNLTFDEQLYTLTRAQICPKNISDCDVAQRGVLVYSAAYNNLSTAPYKTLTLMSETLQYLTLRGNQFAAYTPEMQMETLTRLLNDTAHHKETITAYKLLRQPIDGQFKNLHDKHDAHHETYHQYEHDNDDEHNEYKHNHHKYHHHHNKHKHQKQYYSSNESEDSDYVKWKKMKKQVKKQIEYIKKDVKEKELGLAWAIFPPMPALIELDISNCRIEYVGKDAFQNLTSLRRLYMAYNKMLTIPFDAFAYVPRLQYLDISHTNVLEFNYLMPLPTLEAIFNLIYGVKVQQMAFKELTELVYLDMSHTKLTRNSAVAFTHLGEKLQFLSLCYTSFPLLGNALFKNTNLMALDLSGNPYASTNIIDDAFEGVATTLRYLYFENSNIKDLSWLKYLSNLKVLGLAGNNVNYVSEEIFAPLRSLQILDLSSNHVGNWYQSAFSQNKDLRVLNLRENNINMLTSEMLKDFQPLEYLSLGINNFVCDCMLVDMVEVSQTNNREAECKGLLGTDTQYSTLSLGSIPTIVHRNLKSSVIEENFELKQQHLMNALDPLVWSHFMTQLRANQLTTRKRIREQERQQRNSQPHHHMRFVSREAPSTVVMPPHVSGNTVQQQEAQQCPPTATTTDTDNTLIDSALHFQLLDYEEDSYWCFNETERMSFMDLNCAARSTTDLIVEKLEALTYSLVGVVTAMLAFLLLAALIYWKRWHILYYYSSLKSAALLAMAAKDSGDKFSTLAERDPNSIYDIFISYCQNDRQWVLEELLPNVEETGDVSICMHERDFQIGMTILDNIISCMDRSRALMLIISTNFLLSHWCQFEMYLAQHRILEVSREHLILVFLEDIPRSKRPKTLQYLMDVKTYIMWPAASGSKTVKAEDKKLFWHRLKRSLDHIHSNS